uniref:Uncharacterized protein n=1 Tax=Globodera rostochiensis TaxID=31243 RepID=A0A914IB88_GLORO
MKLLQFVVVVLVVFPIFGCNDFPKEQQKNNRNNQTPEIGFLKISKRRAQMRRNYFSLKWMVKYAANCPKIQTARKFAFPI